MGQAIEIAPIEIAPIGSSGAAEVPRSVGIVVWPIASESHGGLLAPRVQLACMGFLERPFWGEGE